MQFQKCGWFFPFILLGITTFGYSQEILTAPKSITVFVDQLAMFTCETRGDISAWRLNGTTLQNLPSEIESKLMVSGTNTANSRVENLTVPATAEYNGTRVQCLVLNIDGLSIESENVVLKIQGHLSMPSYVVVNFNVTSFTISWTAPFSLDVTGVEPDIWYSVLIYNVTDENNLTAILSTDTNSISETHYTFTPDYLGPCHVYNFSVIPVNGAGQGESSPNVTSCVRYASRVKIPYIQPISRRHFRVTFQGHDGSICRYQLNFEEIDNCVLHKSSSPDGFSITFDICADKEYVLKVATCSDDGEIDTQSVFFTTYDVQNVTAVVSGENELDITAKLVGNTTAKGYFVVLRNTSGPPDIFIAVTTKPDSIENIPASTYSLLVYDLEEDGLPNMNPAFEQNDSISVHGEVSVPESTSRFLKSVNIQIENSNLVKIGCEFEDGVQEASCVLIYRKYNNNTLLVKEYPQGTIFPVNVTVDGASKYTFALFGKSGYEIDERSFVAKDGPPSTMSTSSTPIIITVIGAASAVAAVSAMIVFNITLVRWWLVIHRRESGEYKPSAAEAKNRKQEKPENDNNRDFKPKTKDNDNFQKPGNNSYFKPKTKDIDKFKTIL